MYTMIQLTKASLSIQFYLDLTELKEREVLVPVCNSILPFGAGPIHFLLLIPPPCMPHLSKMAIRYEKQTFKQ
jgi:hypothetical protein